MFYSQKSPDGYIPLPSPLLKFFLCIIFRREYHPDRLFSW